MKSIISITALLLLSNGITFALGPIPLLNAQLQSDLDGHTNSVTNVVRIAFSPGVSGSLANDDREVDLNAIVDRSEMPSLISPYAGHLACTGFLSFTVTQEWDFTSDAWTNAWEYLAETGTATWVEGKGVLLAGQPYTYGAPFTQPRLLLSATPTATFYRVTFYQVAGGTDPASMLFIADGREYGFLSGCDSWSNGVTNVSSVVFFNDWELYGTTNYGHRVGLVRWQYYSPLYISRVRIESTSLTSFPQAIVADGVLLPTLDGVFHLGSANRRWLSDHLVGSGVGITGTPKTVRIIQDDVDPRSMFPRWLGDEMESMSSNGYWRATGGVTSNHWRFYRY